MADDKIQQAKHRIGIIGNDPQLERAVWRALKVAPIDVAVLVTGESGTGKEFFPQIIHAFSPRKHARYIAVNCGAIPEGTIDSELFGHEKGAFTGAVATRKGYFEEADGGTVFLDEVAELPLTTQARLLRVLESGEFMKVGSSQVQKTNIRIVAATNEDMARAVAQGRFREDLFYRLSAVRIKVPPLRERGNDISLLARKFASDFAGEYRTAPVSFSPEALMELTRYRWPGNVRELRNVITRLAVFAEGELVSGERMRAELPAEAASYTPVKAGAPGSDRYEREREMLFNLIFRMQEEIEGLRRRIEPSESSARALAPHGAREDAPPPSAAAMPTSLVKYRPIAPGIILPHPADDGVIPVTPAEEIPPARTLEDTERETIRRALARNQGRRKATAAELHISERTLYRKIKEYGLE